MASKRFSAFTAFIRRLPKAHQTLAATSALLVACSVTLFAFAIPPVLDSRAGDVFQEALLGFADTGDQTTTANASENAESGNATLPAGDIKPIGASSLGSVVASGIASSADNGKLTSQGQQNSQGSQGASKTSSSAAQTTTGPDSQAEYSGLTDDFYNAGDHYACLSNYVSGSPMFATYGPGYDFSFIYNWEDMQGAYSMSRECISEASAFESKYAQLVAQYPASKRELGVIRSAWSSISSAASLFIRFLDAARACPDPSTHSECFMSIVNGHIVGVTSGGYTYYTLDGLESARQTLSSF